MGHSTVRAAMRYQYSTDRRDREIAAEMSRRADAAQGVDEKRPDDEFRADAPGGSPPAGTC